MVKTRKRHIKKRSGGYFDRSLKNLLIGDNRVKDPEKKRSSCTNVIQGGFGKDEWHPDFGKNNAQYRMWFEEFKNANYGEVQKALTPPKRRYVHKEYTPSNKRIMAGLVCGLEGEDYHKNSRYRPQGVDGIGTKMRDFFVAKQKDANKGKSRFRFFF